MTCALGFTFNGKHSSKFNIAVKSDDRSLLPPKRKNEFVVPGRDGTIDYGHNTYEKRIITLKLTLINRSMTALRESARDVAMWLSGEGLLIFDDEPDKAYSGKVYSAIAISQLATYGEASVPFECQPFAEDLYYNQVVENFTDKPHGTVLNSKGTHETPCIIIIKNIGATNINSIVITRKAGI